MDNFLLLPSRGKNSITSLKSFSLRLVARKWHSRIKCGQPHSAAPAAHTNTPVSSLPFNLSQNLSAKALRIRKPLDSGCLASVVHERERVGREMCMEEEEEEERGRNVKEIQWLSSDLFFFIIFISSAIDSVSVLAHYALFYFFCAATTFYFGGFFWSQRLRTHTERERENILMHLHIMAATVLPFQFYYHYPRFALHTMYTRSHRAEYFAHLNVEWDRYIYMEFQRFFFRPRKINTHLTLSGYWKRWHVYF